MEKSHKRHEIREPNRLGIAGAGILLAFLIGLAGNSPATQSKNSRLDTNSGGCVTCHTVIDKPGYENGRQPLRTHPNLKLYVQASSKHPASRVGCTICHGGREPGNSFMAAAHTPDGERQIKEWEEKYGWRNTRSEASMLPRSYFYAACYECHSRQTVIPESGPIDPKSTAGNLDRGLRTIEITGCFGCHTIRGMERLRKVGPDLTRIASKTDPRFAFRWIRDPRGFRNGPRPRGFRIDARMPNFFLQSNQEDKAEGERPRGVDAGDAEIEAIVAYLWDKSEVIRYAQVSGGDAAKGKKLVRSIGCLACHTDDPEERFSHRTNPRAFGPNFEGMGSKTSQEWLFNWLKDPKSYWKEAHMPDLRLSDQEALDVSAHLMTLRNLAFEKTEVPPVDAKTRDWLVIEHLRGRMSNAEARAKLKSMSEQEKKLYLGEQSIKKYGCFGCHVIKGFENAPPVGSDLTDEGSKAVERLDFGNEAGTLERSLPAWLNAKLRNPRRFDQGKTGKWNDKLKMPNFYFNDQEVKDVVTALLGFAKSRAAADLSRASTPAIEEGRRLIRDKNCVGCHIIGKEGGAIASTIENPAYAPPGLNGEGEKVTSAWLISFLKKPAAVRPWLNVRMPTFALNDAEVVAIARMFSALDNAGYPFENSKPDPVAPEIAAAGAKLFDEFKCMQCHGADQAGDTVSLAPDLALARSRLRPLWIEKLLRDPEAVQPGTTMPSYFPDMRSPDKTILGGDATLQIKALRNHILHLGAP